jgi:hypothetical protein
MSVERTCWGLLRRRSCLAPTWQGGLGLLLGLALLLALVGRETYPFLALSQPRPGGVLVIDAWVPDSVLEAGIAEFKRHHYDAVIVTGGPVEQGGPLAGYGNHADLCAATLLKLGMSSNFLRSVPAASVRPDRIYASALALKRWWQAHGAPPTNVNVLVVGPRARRARLLFKRVLGKQVTVGVVAFPPDDYDASRWWRSSQGFRTVTSELLGYCYARLMVGSW